MAASTTSNPPGASSNPLFEHMDSLRDPKLVTIIVGKDKTEFKVPKGLICGLSEYFDKAFSERFAEGQNGSIELPDAEAWVFSRFFTWLYTQALTWNASMSTTLGDGPSLTERLACGHHASDLEAMGGLKDPSAWEYNDLFEIYIFADMYGMRRLCNAVIEHIQIKAFQERPHRFYSPGVDACAEALHRLPHSSTLFQLLVDMFAYDMNPSALSDASRMERLGVAALARIATVARQLARHLRCDRCSNKGACTAGDHINVKGPKAPYWRSWCVYHEHGTKEEKDLCRKRMATIRNEHGVSYVSA